jgi:hypothetical protein
MEGHKMHRDALKPPSLFCPYCQDDGHIEQDDPGFSPPKEPYKITSPSPSLRESAGKRASEQIMAAEDERLFALLDNIALEPYSAEHKWQSDPNPNPNKKDNS